MSDLDDVSDVSDVSSIVSDNEYEYTEDTGDTGDTGDTADTADIDTRRETLTEESIKKTQENYRNIKNDIDNKYKEFNKEKKDRYISKNSKKDYYFFIKYQDHLIDHNNISFSDYIDGFNLEEEYETGEEKDISSLEKDFELLVNKINLKLNPYYDTEQISEVPDPELFGKEIRFFNRLIIAEINNYIKSLLLKPEDSLYNGIFLKLIDTDDTMSALHVYFHSFDPKSNLGKSLSEYEKKTGKPPVVKLQLEYLPGGGQFDAPFLWIRSPILSSIAEFGLFDGALCLDGLTSGIFTFKESLGSLLQSVRLAMENNLVVRSSGYYSRASALRGKLSIENIHKGSWGKALK